MIRFCCTKKCLEYLRRPVTEKLKKSDAILGEWYVNIVPTFRGDTILFVNNPTRLTIVIPDEWVLDIESDFKKRLLDLYQLLNLPAEFINHEKGKLDDFQYARTDSRSLLGSMNDIAVQLQAWAEGVSPGHGDTLESFELGMSQMPHQSLDDENAVHVIHQLIKTHFEVI